MRLNADAFLDAAHSYLSFEVRVGTSGNAPGSVCNFVPDIGVPFISRIRLSSGGNIIEDIEDFNKLYAFMLLNQSSGGYANNDGGASGFNHHKYQEVPNGADRGMTQASARYMGNAAGVGVPVSTAGGVIAPNAQGVVLKYCLPLMTGLFNLDKYLPLLMCQSGIDVDIFLEDAGNCGAVNVPAVARVGATLANSWNSSTLAYEVSNVEYVATLINLDADFNMRLKSIIDQTGALQLSGTTFRHMQNAIDGLNGSKSITMPIRVKSIKSIFTLFEPTFSSETRMAQNIQASLSGADDIAAAVDGGASGRFVLTNNSCMDITGWQFRIGATVYPATPVKVCGTPADAQVALQTTEAHSEVSKALGKLGDYQHEISYSNGNFYKPLAADNADALVDAKPGPRANQPIPCFAVAYDFESFQKATNAIESGINTADRSLPITLELTAAPTAGVIGAAATNKTNCNAHTYVMADAIWYITSGGDITVSV